MNRAAGDLISRKQAIKEILAFCPQETKPGSLDEYGVAVLSGIIEVVLKRLPAVGAVPVMRGQWVEKRWMTECDWCVINHRALVCTACNIEIADGEKTPYCPYCGAKMEAKNE